MGGLCAAVYGANALYGTKQDTQAFIRKLEGTNGQEEQFMAFYCDKGSPWKSESLSKDLCGLSILKA